MTTLKSIALSLCAVLTFAVAASPVNADLPPVEGPATLAPPDPWTQAVTALARRENLSEAQATLMLAAFLRSLEYHHPNPTVDQWRETAIEAGWPQELWRWQSCVINRESGGQPHVKSRTSDYGLMQINRVNLGFLRSAGIAWQMADLYDPLTNLRAAKALYDLSGKSPWAAQRRRC